MPLEIVRASSSLDFISPRSRPALIQRQSDIEKLLVLHRVSLYVGMERLLWGGLPTAEPWGQH